MSEKKTIQINPDLFKVQSTNRTRKNSNGGTTDSKIKMKIRQKSTSNKSLRKNIIKMIRENQQKKYEKIFTENEKPSAKKHMSDLAKDDGFNFDQTVDFFQSLAKKKNDKIGKNHTLRTKHKGGTSQFPTEEFVSMELPDDFMKPTDTTYDSTPITYSIGQSNGGSSSIVKKNPTLVPKTFQYHTPTHPTYGCLKGGKLPTYRQYTQKQNPALSSNSSYGGSKETPPIEQWKIHQKEIREKFKNDQKDNAPMTPKKKVLRNLKRKKIYKRTYHVGRHKVHPHIGVLISNRTVRNKISTDCQLLKQTPIQDVKKFLLKKGFIKIGTSAPNEVLRKMYESVSMICGEIQNHNSENFLYNYLHDQSSSM